MEPARLQSPCLVFEVFQTHWAASLGIPNAFDFACFAAFHCDAWIAHEAVQTVATVGAKGSRVFLVHSHRAAAAVAHEDLTVIANNLAAHVALGGAFDACNDRTGGTRLLAGLAESIVA